MVELHISLEPMAGNEQELERTFSEEFAPAAARQDGFRRVTLLKKENSLREYEIDLVFESEDQRLRWVASDDHQDAFPRIAELCQHVSHHSFSWVIEREFGQA